MINRRVDYPFCAIFLIIFVILTGCASTDYVSESEEFSQIKVYNPKNIKLQIVSIINSQSGKNKRLCWIKSDETKIIRLGNKHEYYFADENGKKIADFPKDEDGKYFSIWLSDNEPREGNAYLVWSQYYDGFLKPSALDCVTRKNKKGELYKSYKICLYQLLNGLYNKNYSKESPANFIASDRGLIYAYPCAAFWVDSEAYATFLLGQRIIYNDDFRSNFINIDNPYEDWSFSEYDPNKKDVFHHRVVNYIVTEKDVEEYETVFPVGTKTEVLFYNPTEEDVRIFNPANELITTVKASQTSVENLYQNYPYYFKDEKQKIKIEYGRDDINFLLRLEKPFSDRKYLCLNQNKKNEINITYDSSKGIRYYGFDLYEILDKNSESAYKYSENIYISYYPSGVYWFDDKTFAEKWIGKEMIYTDDLFSKFEIKDNSSCWGWGTQIKGKKYMHFVSKKLFYRK